MFYIVRARRLLAQITNDVMEATKEFIRATNEIVEIRNRVCKLYKGFKEMSSLTLPLGPCSVTKAIKRVNPQIKK